MKPSQASIYREIELLLEFTIPMAERFPKSLPYRELGGRLILDLKESMDFVVLAFQAENRLERLETDKRFLIELRLKATQWLKKNLKLKLHPDKFYLQEVRKGVKFVGAVIKPGRLYTSGRTLGNMRNRVRGTDRVCRQIIEGGVTKERLRDLKRHVCSLNSYMGFCVHNYTYNQRWKMFNDFPYFWKCCNIQRRFTLVKVKKKFNYESFLIREDAELHKNERAGLPRYGDRRKRLRSKRDDRQRRRDRG